MQECDADEKLLRKVLNVAVGKGRKVVALEKIED